MNNYNVILLVPRLDNRGGVANYYDVIRPHLCKKFLYVYRGKNEQNKLFRLINDYYHYFKILKYQINITAVVINSSLGFVGLLRDGFYLQLTPIINKKIVFFRGWNLSFQKRIDNSFILKFWLTRTFLNADHIIVLSSEFKEKLREWGYKGEITTETTVVDENLLEEFNFIEKKSEDINLLFLSRIEKDKGVFEAVDAVFSLLNKGKDIEFSIAGNGTAMNELKNRVNNLHTDKINLKGYVKGEDKTDSFSTANLFIFPSVHGEGMPNSILEAMAFGLPVLTTRVGGIPDFFEEGKMGLFLDNRKPEHIAEKIEYLLDRPELMKEMSEYNYHYAKEHFYASKVADRLEKIIDDVVEGKA